MAIEAPCQAFSILGQLVSAGASGMARAEARPRQRPLSPRVRKVMAFLLSSQSEFRRQHEVREATGLDHSAVCWALLLLRRNGLVDAVPDSARNARYFRYRAKK